VWNQPRSARGAATGDLLNRNLTDVVLNNLDSIPTFLMHEGGSAVGNWISIRLIGDPKRGTPRTQLAQSCFANPEVSGSARKLPREGNIFHKATCGLASDWGLRIAWNDLPQGGTA
jgi:hypothetical protein